MVDDAAERQQEHGIFENDPNIFEIQDFSVATPWEQLIAAIEDALREWLKSGDAGGGTIEVPVELRGVSFFLLLKGVSGESAGAAPPDATLPCFMREMLAEESDFSSVAFSELEAERILRWFGIRSFVMLVPESVDVVDADEMAELQGALLVALSSCGCQVPAFVLHDRPKGAMCGRAAANAVSGAYPHSLGCRFDVARYDVDRVPSQLLSPGGLIALLRSKLVVACETQRASSSSHDGEPSAGVEIRISRRHTYLLPSADGWLRG